MRKPITDTESHALRSLSRRAQIQIYPQHALRPGTDSETPLNPARPRCHPHRQQSQPRRPRPRERARQGTQELSRRRDPYRRCARVPRYLARRRQRSRPGVRSQLADSKVVADVACGDCRPRRRGPAKGGRLQALDHGMPTSSVRALRRV